MALENKEKPPLYFVSAKVDYGLIGGATLAAWALLSSASSPGPAREAAALLSWVVNWPHFSATSWRLYGSRSRWTQFPLTALAVPPLLVLAAAGALASPLGFAPWFVKLFLIWSPYHFSGQSLGLSMIYARRAGFDPGRLGRAALSGFIFGTFLLGTARSEASGESTPYFGIRCPSLGIPYWAPRAVEIGMWASGAVFLLVVLAWCLRSRRFLPPIVLLPAAAQWLWFVQGAPRESFQAFVPFLHSLQYLLLAWSMQMAEGRATRETVWGKSAAWAAANVAGGAALFWALPWAASKLGYARDFAEPVAISAVQLHHFFVDGVIWKLRDPRLASPVRVHVPALLAS